MYYSAITNFDMLNGDGVRVVLWTSGCSHHCPGCQNPETQNPNFGEPFSDSVKNSLMNSLEPDYISGLTLSGGDPLFKENRATIKEIVDTFREKFKDTKTIWVWTGFKFEDIKDEPDIKPILEKIDVLVDGPFILSKKVLGLKWKGSSNQRVIDVQKTLQTGKIKIKD